MVDVEGEEEEEEVDETGNGEVSARVGRDS